MGFCFFLLMFITISLMQHNFEDMILISKRWRIRKITWIHPKLQNINLHNITHSIISRNPRERMFVVRISLLIVTFLSLISQIMLIKQSTKEVNPHPHIAPCVNMWGVTFLFIFFFLFLCHLLNVGSWICHIAREDQVEWTTPTEVRRKWSQIP